MEVDFPRGGAKSEAQKAVLNQKRRTKSDDGPAAKKSTNDDMEADVAKTLFKKPFTVDFLTEGVRGLGSIILVENDFLMLKTLNGIDIVIPLANVSRVYAETFKSTRLTLKDMFTVGQLLAFIVEKGISKQKKQKMERIIGSICPSLVNDCVHSSSLLNGLVLNGAVKSIEEKGVIFDLGLEGDIDGFGSFDSLPDAKKLKVGQVMMVRIVRETNDLKKYVKVSGYPEMDTFEEENMQQNQFMPGTILHANPETITNDGVVVSFKNGIKAFVNREYLPPRLRGDMEKLVKAFRVVVVLCSQNSPLLYVSGHPDIVAISKTEKRILSNEFAVGEFIEGITYSADKTQGIHFVIQEGDDKVALITAKMPPRKVADTEDIKRYYPGTTHKLRILRYSPLDRRVIVTDKKEIFDAEKIIEEYEPGQIVTVKIESIVDLGLRVSFGRGCRGTIFANHTLDIVSTLWKKAFKENQKIKCRVLYKEKNFYYLTAKPSLVNSTGEIVSSYDPDLIDKSVTGMCVYVESKGAIICFYNKISGYLPRKYVVSLPQELTVGMPVTVKIASVDVEHEKITLAIAKTEMDLVEEKVIKKEIKEGREPKSPVKPVRNLHIYPGKIIGPWPFGGTSGETSLMIDLPGNNFGRLHISEMGLKEDDDIENFMKKYKNKSFHVRVIDVFKTTKMGKSIAKQLKTEHQIDRLYELSIIPEKLEEVKMKQSKLLPKLDYKVGETVKAYPVDTPPTSEFQRVEINSYVIGIIVPESYDYEIVGVNEHGIEIVKRRLNTKFEPIEGKILEQSKRRLCLSCFTKPFPKRLYQTAIGRVVEIENDPLRFTISFGDGETATLLGKFLTKKRLSTNELASLLKINDLVNVKFIEESTVNGWIVASANYEQSEQHVNVKPEIENESGMEFELETKPQRRRETKSREESILDKEKSLLKERVKEIFNEVDFDRTVLGNPNSSEAWISYMAHQASNGNIDEARKIAENALLTIESREENERLNVYTAYMNLEAAMGNEESLKEIFIRARNAHEPYEVHKRLTTVFKKLGKDDDLDRLYQVMIKKFGKYKPEVFVMYGTYLYQVNRYEDARELVNKAMQVLPKKQHIETLSRFANLEYTNGDPEKGRTMFEKILSLIPTRGDIWNIYLDKAIKYQPAQEVRDIFERAVDVKLGIQTMKNIFQKWQDFENVYGDPKHLKIVIDKALEFKRKVVNALGEEMEEND